MPLLSKIRNSFKSCITTATDAAGAQTLKLLNQRYPDIEDLMEILDKIKERVKVKFYLPFDSVTISYILKIILTQKS